MALRFELYGVFDLVERLAANPSTKREAVESTVWTLYVEFWTTASDIRVVCVTRTHGTSIQTGHRIRAVRGVSVCWKSVSNSTPKQRVFWRWIIWPLSSIRSTSGLDYVYFANAPITFAAGILTLVVTELIAELIKMNGWQFYSVDFYVRRGPKVNWLIALLFLLNLTFSINSIAQFSDLVQSPRMFDWLMLEILISGHLIVNRDDKRR